MEDFNFKGSELVPGTVHDADILVDGLRNDSGFQLVADNSVSTSTSSSVPADTASANTINGNSNQVLESDIQRQAELNSKAIFPDNDAQSQTLRNLLCQLELHRLAPDIAPDLSLAQKEQLAEGYAKIDFPLNDKNSFALRVLDMAFQMHYFDPNLPDLDPRRFNQLMNAFAVEKERKIAADIVADDGFPRVDGQSPALNRIASQRALYESNRDYPDQPQYPDITDSQKEQLAAARAQKRFYGDTALDKKLREADCQLEELKLGLSVKELTVEDKLLLQQYGVSISSTD